MTQGPVQDDSEPEVDWDDTVVRGYTKFPAVADPDDLELPEPFATPAPPVRDAGAPEGSATDDAD